MNIPKDEIQWREVKYLKHPLTATDEQAEWDYTLILNEPLASWDVFSYWEDERIQSMKTHLTKNDILFDIGAEVGWCSIVYASMVSPQNMVLIEPTMQFWGNIEAIWNKNCDHLPKATAQVLFSDKDVTYDKDRKTNMKVGGFIKTPDFIIDKMAYRYIHDNTKHELDKPIREMKLDTFVKTTGIVPTALTMDTEGSEYLILKGAEETLRNNNLKVWVSIHDDLGVRDYGKTPDDTIALLNSFGYSGEYLATDHESHYFFHRS